MTLIANITQAKAQLSSLIERVQQGEEIIIARAGTPVARLVPFERQVVRRIPGALAGRIVIAADLDELPDDLPPALRAEGACFVTLENHGQLRGCIGNMVATGPLYEAVIRNAISACRDRRFANNPVTAAELSDLDIEISYLTPMRPIDNTDAIVVGRHGLLIERGFRRGVLLPQVAARRGWTREEFLAQTCRKAGLPLDAWKQPGTRIYCFEAEVFGEPGASLTPD